MFKISVFTCFNRKLPLRKKFIAETDIPFIILPFISNIGIYGVVLKILTEMYFIYICWKICSRFRHLNKTILLIDENNALNTDKLKKLICWFKINIKPMSKFNKIFSLPIAVLVLNKVYGLIIATEELIYNLNNGIHYKVFFFDIFFHVYRITLLIYIVKQVSDISREALKVHKNINGLCLTAKNMDKTTYNYVNAYTF